MIPLIDLKEQAGVAMNVRGQFSDSITDFKVTLGALAYADELGRLLWRIKYGQQYGGLHRAVLLLGDRIRVSGKFSRAHPVRVNKAVKGNRIKAKQSDADATDVIDRVSRRLLQEWIHDQCTVCNGRGIAFGAAVQQRADAATSCDKCSGRGRMVVGELVGPFVGRVVVPYAIRTQPKYIFDRCDCCHGRGVTLEKQKRERTRVCGHCDGSGREPVNESARARALGISLDQYRRGWSIYFDALHQVLDQVDAQVDDVVRHRLKK